MNPEGSLLSIHDMLLAHYGSQGWWPAETAFEMMIGAILTQNTSWTNVEYAIAGLRGADLLNAEAIATADEQIIAESIRPSGYFNQKAKRLKNFARFYLEHCGEAGLSLLPEPRKALLALNGIGPETADSMLLYALDVPAFVIDAYTRRIFSRLGFTAPNASYQQLQDYFQTHLASSVSLFQEYHALIVIHAKTNCRSRPVCTGCPLFQRCVYALGLADSA